MVFTTPYNGIEQMILTYVFFFGDNHHRDFVDANLQRYSEIIMALFADDNDPNKPLGRLNIEKHLY